MMTTMHPALRLLLIDTPQRELADLATAIKTEITAHLEYHAVADEGCVPALLATTACDLVIFYGGDGRDIHWLTQHLLSCPRSGQILILLAKPTVEQTVTLMRAGSCGVVDKHDTRQVLALISDILTAATNSTTESIYQDIVENQTELICRYDADFRLLFVNKAYSEWHKSTPDQLVGKTFLHTIPAEEQAQFIAKIQNLTVENPVAVAAHAEIRPDSSLRVTEWTDRAIFDASGELVEYQAVGRDITEREAQAQRLADVNRELGTQRSHFSAVLDTMQDALNSISLVDREVIFVSKAFADVYGYPYEKFQADPEFFKQVVHPDDVEQTIKAQQTCLTEGFAEHDHRIIWPDGQVRWLHRRAWINYDEQGRPIRVNDSARDITERKRNQQALQERETNLQTLFDTIDDFLFILDEAGNIIEVNQTVIQRLGYAAQELLGQPVIKVHPLARHTEAAQIIGEILQGTNRICSIPLQTSDGQLIPVETQVTRGIWNGKPAIFGLSKDVSELKMSEEKFATVFRVNPAIMGLSDLETGKYVEVNDAFCAKLGFTKEEAIGAKAAELVKLEENWRARTVEKLTTQGYVRDEETVIYAKNGSVIPVILSAEIITLQGRPYNFTIAVDISELKTARETVQQQADLLQQVSDAIITFDNERKITSWNAAAQRIYGWTEAEARGHLMEDLVQAEWLTDSPEIALEQYSLTDQWQGELREKDKSGTEHYIITSVNRLHNERGEPVGGVLINRDITAVKKQQLLGGRLRQVLEEIAKRQPLTIILNLLARAIEEFNPELKASILLLDANTQALRHGAAPSLPSAYIEAIDGAKIGPNTGSCGTAAYEKRLVIVDDIEHDPLWHDYKELAAAFDLKACWSQPVINQNQEVLATFATYYHEVRQPIPAELELIQLASYIAGLAIEHAQAEADLKASQEQFRQFMRYLPGAVFIKNEADETIYCNELYATQSGTTPDQLIGKTSSDYVPAELAASFAAENLIVLHKNRAMEFNHQFPGSEGMSYWHTVKFPIPREGQSALIGAMSLDVTREKQAEEAILRSERRYRQMFERMNLPKLIIHADTAQILDANPAAESFYGYPLATLKAMTMMQINIADEQTIREKIRKILAKEISSCPFEQRLADGTIRDVEVFATAIEVDGRQVLYSAFVDVTDRKRFQAALQKANQELEERVQARTQALEQSRDRLAAIFNHSGDGILLVDTELRIQQSNFAVGEMFGIAEDDFTNHTLPEIIAGNKGVELEAVVQGIIHSHLTGRIEAQGMRADGTQFAAEISIAPINRSDRAVENMVCIIRDISERKQAEAERQQHLALIEDLYNNAPTGYHSTDANNVIIQINDTELKWLGYTREEVVGKRKSSDFLTPASLKRWAESLPVLLDQNEISGLELELMRKDGTTFWIAGSASAICDKDGKFLRTRTVVHDITELKQAQNTIAEERNLLRTVIDAVPDFIYVKDTQHRMVLNNVSHTQSLGASVPADVIGKTDFDLFPREMAAKFHADEQSLLTKSIPVINVEERSIGMDGNEIWALTTKAPLKNIQGELIGLVGITRNVTELKQKEDALRRSEQQLRESQHMLQLVLDTIPVRVFWKDLNLNYLGCNRLFADDAGLAETYSIVGRSDLDMPWAAEQGEAYRADDRKVIANGIPKLNYEEPQLNSEGKWITLQTSKIPLRDVNDQIMGMLGTYVDITERKEAEEKLRYLASLQAFISDSVVSLDLSLRIQSWNKAAETMFGWPADEVIGRTLHELIKIDIPGKNFEEAMQELYRTGFWYGESLIHHRDGTPKNLTSSIGFTRDETGQPTGFITVHHDITERVRTERALQQSEEQYRMLAENVKDVIVKIDVEGNLLFATPSATVMLGYSPEELAGMNGFTIVHPDDLERVAQTLQAAFEAGATSFQLEERLRHKDGHYIWVDAASNIVYDSATQEPIQTVGVLRDITDRKATELALRASEEKFRMFIELAPIATVITNRRGEIVILNKAAEQSLGYCKDELINQSVQLLVPFQKQSHHLQLMAGFASTETGQHSMGTEVSVQRKDGAIFPADIQLSQVQVGSEPLIMAFIIDMTQRNQAEATLKQALAKEKELSELKSRFVSMASHQFRTPLTAILASAETLTYYRDRMDDAQIDMRLDRIRNQVAFMKNIMEDVLELARIQANQVRYQPVEGDLDALCQQIIEDFEHQKAYTGRISYTATPAPLNAKFDPHLMHHLISNLIHNALKYSAAETPVDVSVTQTDSEIIFAVKDQGIGMSPEDQKHLFEPFFRAINVGTISGTGLGLSIVKQAVEAHDGAIQFSSEVGHGTTVVVTLPFTR